MDKLPNRPNISSIKKEAIIKLERWLKEENYSFITKETDNVDYFAIVDTIPKFYIVIQKNRIDRIDLGADVSLISRGQSIISSMAPKKQKTLILNLQAELLQMHLICALRPNFEKVEKIEIRTNMYFDGLTKDRFFGKILEIQRAYALVSTRMDEARKV